MSKLSDVSDARPERLPRLLSFASPAVLFGIGVLILRLAGVTEADPPLLFSWMALIVFAGIPAAAVAEASFTERSRGEAPQSRAQRIALLVTLPLVGAAISLLLAQISPDIGSFWLGTLVVACALTLSIPAYYQLTHPS